MRKADKFTVFADKIKYPTVYLSGKWGHSWSPKHRFLFLKDNRWGDDIADVKKLPLVDGGFFDTHADHQNLQRGIDNDIYGVVGYSGFLKGPFL